MLLVIALFGTPTFLLPSKAQAANPGVISFQGKVVNANGTNVADGTYSFNFVMFDDSALGSESDGVHDKWHELNKSVVVSSGVFQTNLGSATALPDFNANPNLYLAVKFNSDSAGYMTPRIQLGSVPYASNADKVGGLSASSLVQLSPGSQQSGNINISGTISSGTVNGQTLGSTSTFTGTLTIQGASSLTLGTASGNRGAIILRNSAGSNTVTLQAPAANPTSSFSLTLPSILGASGDCLKQSDGTGTLAFGSCGAGGSGDLQAAYNTDASGVADIITSSAAKTVLVKAGAGFDASTLFQVQNAAGTPMLTVDSINGFVGIGRTPTATLSLIGVASDPASPSNGDLWYNSTENRWRLRESGVTTNLYSTDLEDWYTYYSDFAGDETGVAQDWITIAGTHTAVAGTQGIWQIANVATAGTDAGAVLANTATATSMDLSKDPELMSRVTYSAIGTGRRAFLGFVDNNDDATLNVLTGTITGNGVYFMYDPANTTSCGGGTTWRAITRTAGTSTATCVDTGVALTANTYNKLRILDTGSTVKFYVDGVEKASISTNVPSAALRPVIINTSTDTTADNLMVDYYFLRMKR